MKMCCYVRKTEKILKLAKCSLKHQLQFFDELSHGIRALSFELPFQLLRDTVRPAPDLKAEWNVRPSVLVEKGKRKHELNILLVVNSMLA